MARPFASLLLILLLCQGCGGGFLFISTDGCAVVAVRISPQTAIADHNSLPPGNTVVFSFFQTTSPPACSVTVQAVVWTTSDPSVAVVNNGGAVRCVDSSTTPVTITADVTSTNGSQMMASGALTCN
jgi:hypothetical protein